MIPMSWFGSTKKGLTIITITTAITVTMTMTVTVTSVTVTSITITSIIRFGFSGPLAIVVKTRKLGIA
jgi:hypothetical protein